jgi:hypothetical protein
MDLYRETFLSNNTVFSVIDTTGLWTYVLIIHANDTIPTNLALQLVVLLVIGDHYIFGNTAFHPLLGKVFFNCFR